MDPFGEERLELTGSLITMEFGIGGRITQLWATDPALPEEGDDFQFVLPPIQFGEENAEDYYPGTILLGARTNPDEPWVLSRNGEVIPVERENEFESGDVEFQYAFPLLEEISGTGRFYEEAGPIPQAVWSVEVRNEGRRSVEIGEVGFPLAFNNYYDGFGWSDEQLKKLWQSRLYLHQYIAGSASWMFAQRMTAETPGLLVFPGADTSWEFFSHVRASLQTPNQWEGIPVVYAHSKATVERERWDPWFNEHTAVILEPGDSRRFEMRFVPTETDKREGIHNTLMACGKPSVRVLPSAVAPVDVGVALEVNGAAPQRYWLSRSASVEVDSDASERSGFCYVRPDEPGPLRVSFKDDHGRFCHAHLMFTRPIRELIEKRADYIVRNQVEKEIAPFQDAILLTNCDTDERVTDRNEYAESSGIECSLADALFLAEKNTFLPVREQIDVLNRYVDKFLLDDVQNPSNHAVGSVLSPGASLWSYYGRPLTYPLVINLYHAMYRVARSYGETTLSAKELLLHAHATALAMFRFGWRHYVRTVGVLGFARCYELFDDLIQEGLDAEAESLKEFLDFKAEELCNQEYPYAGESAMDTSGFEEVFNAAKWLDDDEHLERTVRCAFAARSPAPSWWWYGGDKRCGDGMFGTGAEVVLDRGETCLAHTTIPNSSLFFQMMDRDYFALPETYMRMAFGGMVGPWALVRNDGAVSMCFCPDQASKLAGYNPYTGQAGLGLFHYLRQAGAYVLPNRSEGVYTFGCHFVAEEGRMRIKPWDGVGRRVVLRQIGLEFSLAFGRFVELEIDERKRWFSLIVENAADKPVDAELVVQGMWGATMEIEGQEVQATDGIMIANLRLPAKRPIRVTGKVKTS